MLELTPVDLNSVAVIGANCGDIAVGAGATLIEIACDKTDLVEKTVLDSASDYSVN